MKAYEENREPILNPHDLIDKLGATLGGIVYRKDRLFGKSLESPPLREAVPETHTRTAAFDTGVWQQVTAKGPAGSLPVTCESTSFALSPEKHYYPFFSVKQFGGQ